jgi:hypothetical protein
MADWIIHNVGLWCGHGSGPRFPANRHGRMLWL